MQRYNGQLINQFANVINGNAAAGALVTVKLKSTGATVTLYATDDIGGATLANPLTADAKGYYGFYAPDGVYTLDVSISGTPQLEIQLQDVAALQAQFNDALANAGYIPVGTFAAGCTVSQSNGVVSDGSSFWRWDGALPKTVTAGSAPTPTGVSNWILVSDGGLRGDLADSSSTVSIAGTDAADVSAIVSKFNIDGSRLQSENITVGNMSISGAALRDAVVVGRIINGLTDCHAFADSTIIQNATDSGTYGTFDSTTKLQGTHTQAHLYSYQDRVSVEGGSGSVLTDSTGLHIDSRNNGSGVVVNRIGVHVNDMAVTAGGSVTNSTGIIIRNISQATSSNIGLQIDQSSPSTFAYYAPNGGAMHNFGKVGFGAIPSNSFAIRFSNGAGNRSAFAATTSASVQFGVEDDGRIDFLTNGVERLQIQQSGNTHNVTPGVTNSQFLGQADKRWKGCFAGQITFTGIASADALNNSLFVDSADNLLKFKDSTGTVTTV